jgi:hypothetical protein
MSHVPSTSGTRHSQLLETGQSAVLSRHRSFTFNSIEGVRSSFRSNARRIGRGRFLVLVLCSLSSNPWPEITRAPSGPSPHGRMRLPRRVILMFGAIGAPRHRGSQAGISAAGLLDSKGAAGAVVLLFAHRTIRGSGNAGRHRRGGKLAHPAHRRNNFKRSTHVLHKPDNFTHFLQWLGLNCPRFLVQSVIGTRRLSVSGCIPAH